MGKKNKKGLAKKLAFKMEMKSKRKDNKKLKTAKRAKLIVRNLPFQASEDTLREHFKQYGDLSEVTLLKKSDGKLVGCGFVQFNLVQKAAKARYHLNGKPFMGRNIEVDFALPKDAYKKSKKKEKRVETVEVKEESTDDIDASVVKIEDDISDTEVKLVEEKVEGGEEEQHQEEESKDESEDDNDSNSDDDEDDYNRNNFNNQPVKQQIVSSDVSEGKTVFIKNVPFSATNEDLKACILQFGPVHYCLICMDKLTEHSKGTAFVKFTNREDAEKCLQAGTELKLQDNILDCHRALNRDELKQKGKSGEEEAKKHKDSRNLYLVKEGVILAGSKAAENVSASDMAKRLQLEQYKTQMLRNLNMYIASNRLIIHNLPQSWDDSKLRTLFQKFSGPKAVIREARIMRNMRNMDSQGIGQSKQYGFVTFTTNEHALTALRALNNNPNIFSVGTRPIVAFSIENRKMVKAKEKRLQRSLLNNPKYKGYNQSLDNKTKKDDKNNKEPKRIQHEEAKHVQHDRERGDGEMEKYTGVTARPGIGKMRSKFNLRTQAKLHHENLKKEKKKVKFAKKTLAEKRKDFIRQPAQKINKQKRKESDNFSQLVNEYKQRLINATVVQKPKWYEEN